MEDIFMFMTIFYVVLAVVFIDIACNISIIKNEVKQINENLKKQLQSNRTDLK